MANSMLTPRIHHEARSEFLQALNGDGVLVIHGFTGSTQSMRLYAYGLHEQGYTVSMPCLTGHGTTPEEMAKATDAEWKDDVIRAFKELQSKVKNVYVAGLSMGGALTLFLAENFDVAAIATVNAASMNVAAFEAMSLDPKTPNFIPGIGSDIKKPGMKEWAYDRTPKAAITPLITLCKEVDRNLAKIVAPAIVFSSNEDHVVPPEHSRNIINKISSRDKKLVRLSESYHVATLDNDLPEIIDATARFFSEHKSALLLKRA